MAPCTDDARPHPAPRPRRAHRKRITTPENYPLSLNALLNACNQRSSRDPVLDLDEEQVRQALHALEDLGLATPFRDARVPKYEHRARTILNLRRDETAILCLLLLRGPQTPGELRSRADRLYTFDDLAAVQSTLERLANRGRPAHQDGPAAPEHSASHEHSTSHEQSQTAGPLTLLLPRQPGSREARYMHLLGGAPDPAVLSAAIPRQQEASAPAGRIAALEFQLTSFESELADLRAKIEALESRLAQLEPPR